MSNRKDIDALIRQARKAGFSAEQCGKGGALWKITSPAGEHVTIGRNTNGDLSNERRILRSIGYDPNTPPRRPRSPATASAEEPPMPSVPAKTAPPAPPDDLDPAADPDTAAWWLWSVIIETGPLSSRERDGRPGWLWLGALPTKTSGVFPGISQQVRRDVIRTLLGSGNAVCLTPDSSPPSWWLSCEWEDTAPRAAEPPSPELPDHAAESPPEPDLRAEIRAALEAAADAVVRRADRDRATLEAENKRLSAQLAKADAENARLREQLGALEQVKAAMRVLTG
ncbi:hypothetical protein EDD29_0096 [Actinocorallia herbida]|uniref:Uncharacterized protein n=1 Tax=Actinocorallia herbida TaxID=58109 RepID=A0A3N1CN31_9ACTN|nr:hypothetical protein [Actinocorallia herbida]ROO82615.1 hypothetical protein EDD29_0096 [Actinocorallia herbida]